MKLSDEMKAKLDSQCLEKLGADFDSVYKMIETQLAEKKKMKKFKKEMKTLEKNQRKLLKNQKKEKK